MQRPITWIINLILRRFGFALQNHEETWEREAFARLYESRIRHVPRSSAHPAECIVFSKDRALQLHALLSSYLEQVVSGVPVHILYRTSSSSHQKAYQEVIEIFSDRRISFEKETSNESFRGHLISLLQHIQSERVFFLVDDVVFLEKTDIKDLAKFDTDKFVPTLRMGLNLHQCYTLEQDQKQPALIPHIIDDKDKIVWQWNQGICDWAYPLSLDGHFFSTQEIATMIQSIHFSAPNTLEDELQRFRRFFLIRRGVGYRKSRIVNIPCNKVQIENKNLCGDLHQDFLLQQWQKELQMDYRKLYGYHNISAHEEIPFTYTKR